MVDLNTPGTVGSKDTAVSDSSEGTPAYQSDKKRAATNPGSDDDDEEELEVPYAEQPMTHK